MNKKIIILDYTLARVYVFKYDENCYEDGEHFINEMIEEGELETSASNCNWMIVSELNIEIK